MSQPMAPNDGLTANQRRDRIDLEAFDHARAYIARLAAEVRPDSNRLREARAELLAMTRRAPHLFTLDQHGPIVRPTRQGATP